MLSYSVAAASLRQNDGKKGSKSGRSVIVMRPKPTGDWAKDNLSGRRYADNFVVAMRQVEDPSALIHEIDRIYGDGPEYRGIAVGFCNRIAELTIAA